MVAHYLSSETGHISDRDLERLILGTVKDEAELAPLEEHLLMCVDCIKRAEQMREYVETMRGALQRFSGLQGGVGVSS